MAKRCKRRVYRRRKGKSLAAEVNKIKKQLAVRAPEKKYSIYSPSPGQTANWAGLTSIDSLLSNIVVGTGDFNQRIGDKITITGCRLKYRFNIPSANQGALIRVIVFSVKKNPDNIITMGSMPNLIMESTYMGTVQAPHAPYDHDNRASFIVHYDKVKQFNQANVGQTTYVNWPVRFSLGKTGRKINFIAGTASMASNGLYALVLTDQSATINYNLMSWVNYYDT